MSKRKRLIGTTDDAVDRVEARLGRVLPLSLREWYLTHNGSGELSPIRDERDPRTWDDVFELREKFAGYHEDVFGTDREDLAHLVPIMDPGGDTVCPDYGGTEGVEPRVVVVSHEDASVLPIRAARSPVGAPTWREVAEMGSWRPVARPSELRR